MVANYWLLAFITAPLDDTGVDIFPQRNQQLAGERDDRGLLEAAGISVHPILEPAS